MTGRIRAFRPLWLPLLLLFCGSATAGEYLNLLLAPPRGAYRLDRPREVRPRPTGAARALAWQALTLRDETGRIDPDALHRANEHRRESLRRERERFAVQPDAASISRTSWVSRGPQNVGGRTRALLVHPATPSILYAGAATGGVWRSLDSGNTWAPMKDFMGNLAVSTMVFGTNAGGVVPSTIYAGTGEVAYARMDSYVEPFDFAYGLHGAGVFKTTDSGATWNRLSSTADWSAVTSLAARGTTLLAVVIHGSNPQSHGIYRSTDGGATWTRTLASDHPGQGVVAFDPANSSKAVAALQHFDFADQWHQELLYSIDGGVTWTEATVPQTIAGFAGRVDLAYSKSSPSIVYANVSIGAGEIWKSTNGGQSYSLVSPQGVTGCNWGQCRIWVSPVNPNFLILGGVFLHRSTNGGATVSPLYAGYLITEDPHPDQHCFVEHPGFNGTTNRTLYVCNDGGVFRAADVEDISMTGVFPWNSGNWESLNDTYQTTQYYSAAGDAAAFGPFVGGTQDNGTLVTSRDVRGSGADQRDPLEAEYPQGGDGGWVAIDPVDPNIVYGETTYLTLLRGTADGPRFNAAYIDQNLADSGDGPTGAPGAANFIAPFLLDPNDRDVLLAGGSRLWRSTNPRAATPSWSIIRNAGSDYISAIAVAPGSSSHIWIAQNDGVIQKTANGTAPSPSWANVTGPVSGRYVTRIFIDSADAQVVYLAYGGYHPDNFWKSVNGGGSWTSLAGSGGALPPAPVRGIARHPRDPRRLYVGTDVGVYESENGGASWSPAQQGPADVSVYDLQFVRGSETLLAATHGRGLWTADVSSVPTFAGPAVDAVATSTTSVHLTWPAADGASSYRLWRSSGGGAFAQVGGAITAVAYDDFGRAPGTTYVYKLQAVIGGTISDFGPPDLATTIEWTDDGVLTGKQVRALHLQELRAAANAVRAAAALPPLTFPDAIAPGGATLARHITELRSGMTAARNALGVTPASFAQSVVAGTVIKGQHVEELRNAAD